MFYLTLPSNSSQTFFPNNTTTHYLTKLPQTITLKEEYEVGINEIQIPVSWYNVDKNQCWFKITPFSISNDTERNVFPTTIHEIAAGFYKNTEELLHHMNALVSEDTNRELVYFSKDYVSNRLRIFVRKGTLLMSLALARLLGFEKQYYTYSNIFDSLNLHITNFMVGT